MPKIKATKIENIEDAKYGDLIQFKPTYSIFSFMIPIIDGSPFSHTAMYLGRRFGHNWFIESKDGVGVLISRLENWRNFEIWRFDIPIMPISEVLADVGKPYDRLKIVSLLLHKIIGTPLLADDDHALICSEAYNKYTYYELVEKGHATPASFHKLTHGN